MTEEPMDGPLAGEVVVDPTEVKALMESGELEVPDWDRRLHEVMAATGFSEATILSQVLSFLSAPQVGLLEEALEFAVENEYREQAEFAIAAADAEPTESQLTEAERVPAQGGPRITIKHVGGNTISGPAEDVLNHGHLIEGWKYTPDDPWER